MKKYIVILCLFFCSCEVYFTEHKDLTLSGKYVVSKIQITSVDQNQSPDSTYLAGSSYINNYMGDPFDTININNFYIHFDYSTVSFGLLGVDPLS